MLRKHPYQDDRTTRDYIIQGQEEHMTIKYVNKQVASMPERLQAVLDSDG